MGWSLRTQDFSWTCFFTCVVTHHPVISVTVCFSLTTDLLIRQSSRFWQILSLFFLCAHMPQESVEIWRGTFPTNRAVFFWVLLVPNSFSLWCTLATYFNLNLCQLKNTTVQYSCMLTTLWNYLGGGKVSDLAMLRRFEGVGSNDSLLLTDPGVLPHAELDELNKITHANQAK